MSNKNLEFIKNRRSIRKYTNESIDDETIKEILTCAMSAPSAMNQQCWEFIVIKDKDTMKKITEFQEYSKMLNDASLAIVVCGNLKIEKTEGYWVQDCSAAMENLLLAVEALDLGAVWLGIYPREHRIKALSELLKLPDYIKPLGIASIGHKGEFKKFENRYNNDKVHFEKW